MKRLSIAALLSICALFFCVGTGPQAQALDFTCPVDTGACAPWTLWMSGEIKDGDYQRVEDKLKALGPDISLVVLTKSLGGKVIEAIRIGLLLYRLHVATAIGWIGPSSDDATYVFYPEASMVTDHHLVNLPGVEERNAFCSSACVYIWLGGWLRYGYASLEIHRPIDPNAIAHHLTTLQKKMHEEAIKTIASGYLTIVSGTSDLADRIWSVPYDHPEFLKAHYILKDLIRLMPDSHLNGLVAACVRKTTMPTSFLIDSLDALQLSDIAQCALIAEQENRVARWAKLLNWQQPDGRTAGGDSRGDTTPRATVARAPDE